ncbi:helix-turn-helix domain-containing protein [Escherichia coli]
MLRATKVRIYPTPEQAEFINAIISMSADYVKSNKSTHLPDTRTG